jgi:hypothetical protein
MKFEMRKISFAIAMGVATLAFSGSTSAATKPDQMLLFTATTAVQDVTVMPDSFYNLTMGHLGWAHHSAWGYFAAKKGKVYSITADGSGVPGLHPGVSVWSAPQKRNKYVDITYNPDHFYSQCDSVNLKAPVDEATDTELRGYLKWDFITNGFDRDAMEGVTVAATRKIDKVGGTETTSMNVLPPEFDQSCSRPVWDGAAGKVKVTFTAPATGIYKFVVGGINPDRGADLWWNNPDKSNAYEVHRVAQTVQVTVDFPE